MTHQSWSPTQTVNMKAFVAIALCLAASSTAFPDFHGPRSRSSSRASKQLDFGDDKSANSFERDSASAIPISSGYGSPLAESRSAGDLYGAPIEEESRQVVTGYAAANANPSPVISVAASSNQPQASYSTDNKAAPSTVDEIVIVSVDDQEEEQTQFDLRTVIPGEPGQDYPVFRNVPDTSFSCAGKRLGGYYADLETDCQAFHICGPGLDGVMQKYTFLCPNGTIFNQDYLICDWWFNFDCQLAQELAETRNEELFGARNAATRRLQEQVVASPSEVQESIAQPSYGVQN